MNNCYPFINTPLPYEYDALEPFIDKKTMYLHHDKLLQELIDNLNALLVGNPYLQKWTLEELVQHWYKLPQPLQIPIRNNAGGVYNHRFFFDGMQKPERITIDSDLLQRINQHFYHFDGFQTQFKKAAMSVFGSGYAWLVCDNGQLQIVTTANQNTPLDKGLYPLLNLDVWEHAYYLKNYNLRDAYIDNWFHVINWDVVAKRFHKLYASS